MHFAHDFSQDQPKDSQAAHVSSPNQVFLDGIHHHQTLNFFNACRIFIPSEAAKYTAPPERFDKRAIVGTLHLGVSENAVHTQNGSFNEDNSWPVSRFGSAHPPFWTNPFLLDDFSKMDSDQFWHCGTFLNQQRFWIWAICESNRSNPMLDCEKHEKKHVWLWGDWNAETPYRQPHHFVTQARSYA